MKREIFKIIIIKIDWIGSCVYFAKGKGLIVLVTPSNCNSPQPFLASRIFHLRERYQHCHIFPQNLSIRNGKIKGGRGEEAEKPSLKWPRGCQLAGDPSNKDDIHSSAGGWFTLETFSKYCFSWAQ